ncbi:MAG: putative TonB-dependent receptor [Bacteroidetes bacterium]|nr:putative TonB-dependent receptor [Bacteroidota bacterium]
MMIVPLLMSAQNAGIKYQVKGQAIDSVTQETMPYVTCSVVLANKPQQVVARFASDVDGKFSGELKAPGTYIVAVSFVGKQSVKRRFTVGPNNRLVQLGKIGLADSKQSLKEVNVVATRPLIKAEADKITYDTEQDPETKTSTVLDVLRKVPMVTVDGQDNIQLKGASNFKFFLNGKPTNMFNNNPSMILKSMPANMVKNIEVITQPGAKYDAEGVGGIINIVTMQKTAAKGYSATINTQVSTRGSYGGGLNLMVQSGKFSFSGNYNYNYNKQFPLTTISDRQTYFKNAPYPNAHQDATVKTTAPMQFGSGQLSYEMDTLNLFTLSYNRRYGRPKSKTSASTDNYDSNMNPLFSYTQESTQKQTWGSTDLSLDYQHSFKRKGELITLSYKWSNTPNNSNYEASNIISSLYHSVPQYGLFQSSTSKNDAKSNEHTFQVDYSRPLAKGHTLEMGTKYILRLNDSEVDEKYSYFNTLQSYPYMPYIAADSISRFKNDQDILGIYASYAGNVGKWGFKGGVRYEYTWLKAEFDKAIENFSTDYGVVVPSAIITYKISDMQNVKFGYNMRIQRPSIGYLNPYVDRKDPNYISYGNPSLDPEKSHNITAGYSNFTPKYNMSAELTYTFVNNAIEQYTFMKSNESAQVQETTYGNIGHNKQVNLNLFGNYRGIRWLTLFVNGSVSYVNMKSGVLNISNDGYTGRIYGGGTVILPKDMRMSVGGGGMLPQINLQGSQSAFYYSFFSISKDLLQKRFNISMSAVWLPKTHITMDTEGINSSDHTKSFDQHTDIRIGQPLEFRFNVSYRIGSMNAQVKKTRATISNDDQKAKENSSAGQSPM